MCRRSATACLVKSSALAGCSGLSLAERLVGLPDPRHRRGVRHPFLAVLLIAASAVVAGARSWAAIGQVGPRCSAAGSGTARCSPAGRAERARRIPLRRRPHPHPAAGPGQDEGNHLLRRAVGTVRPDRDRGHGRCPAHPARPRGLPRQDEGGAPRVHREEEPARVARASAHAAPGAGGYGEVLRPQRGPRPQGDTGGSGADRRGPGLPACGAGSNYATIKGL